MLPFLFHVYFQTPLIFGLFALPPHGPPIPITHNRVLPISPLIPIPSCVLIFLGLVQSPKSIEVSMGLKVKIRMRQRNR